MIEQKTKIELTEKEANLFIKLFRKYQSIWEESEQLRPGSLVLHFDNNWEIKKHELHFYKK